MDKKRSFFERNAFMFCNKRIFLLLILICAFIPFRASADSSQILKDIVSNYNQTNEFVNLKIENGYSKAINQLKKVSSILSLNVNTADLKDIFNGFRSKVSTQLKSFVPQTATKAKPKEQEIKREVPQTIETKKESAPQLAPQPAPPPHPNHHHPTCEGNIQGNHST